MVSLSRETPSNTGGATFFSDSTNMEDKEYLEPILESFGIFKPLKTIFPFAFHLVCTVALEVAAIVFAVYHPNEQYKCNHYFFLLYAHVAFWFITLIVDQIARVKHYNLRLNGYLEFYKKTLLHHQIPFYAVSLCTAGLLLVEGLMHFLYSDEFIEKCIKGGFSSPTTFVCFLVSFEFCILVSFGFSYIVRVVKFNTQKPPPDVQKEEWNACSSSDSFAQGEIGYRQLGDKVYDFIEKQADLIRHLKDHNARLGEKLMVLTAQKQARSRTVAGN